jgi:NAD kinase
MQHLSPHTVRTDHDHLSFYHDSRSGNIAEIQEFLSSPIVERLQKSIQDRTYVVLGGDGLFVAVAKQAHLDDAQILGINFGSKGFLLHDRSVFDQERLEFEQQEYPILHTDVRIGDEHIHGNAFNEVYITRAGDASSIQLSLMHRSKRIECYR